MPDHPLFRPTGRRKKSLLRRMKKHYLSVFALALFAATASAQFTTKEQANKQIEALAAANPAAAATAKTEVAAANDANGYNQAVKDFYQALNGSKVYFTNSARGGKNYLTLSPAFAAAGDRKDTPTAENVFELEYNEANNSFALFHAVTGRALKNLPGFNTPVLTHAEEGGPYTFVATGKNNTFSLRNDAAGGNQNFLHLAGDKTGAQYNVVRWNAGNGELNDASTWAIESAEDVTDNDLFEAANDRFVALNLLNETFGSALGQRYVTKETQTTLKKLATGQGELADVQDLLSAYADKTSFTLNMPERGDFFRIKSNDGSRYITTDGAAAGEWQLQTTTGTPDENTIFCFDGTNLVSLKTGRAVYLSSNKSQAKLAAYDVATPATVEFGELADGKYKMLLKQGTQTATVHLWQNNKTGVDGSAGDNTKATETHLQLEEVEKVPVQLNAKGLASFCAPYHMEVPAGVEIYVASSFNAAKDRIILTQLSGNIIPEGTAVVLKGTASTKIELTYAKGNMTVTPPAVNLFQGKATPSQIAAGQEARALKGDEFLVLSTPYVRGFRAYLSSAAGGATRSQLAFPGVTGVERVATAENAEAPIFDLSGRRVEKPVAGQIYVQNGQKFLQR